MNDKKYIPTISEDYAAKLRTWQDKVHEEARRQTIQHVDFLGITLTIPPKVHPINPMSDLLGNSVLNEVNKVDSVLDMGTGCGVNAILAASIAQKVVAVDINPAAVEAAIKNAEANGVESKISFVVSDVFSNVEGKFDVIVFDPPFRWFEPRDIYEISTTDKEYRTLNMFFSEVDFYLNSRGRILLSFGSSGDIGYLYKLIDQHKFRKEILERRSLEKDGIEVTYYTFRLTK